MKKERKPQAPSRTVGAPDPPSVNAQLSVRRVASRIKQAHGLNSSTVPTTLAAPALDARIPNRLAPIFIAFGGRSAHPNRHQQRCGRAIHDEVKHGDAEGQVCAPLSMCGPLGESSGLDATTMSAGRPGIELDKSGAPSSGHRFNLGFHRDNALAPEVARRPGGSRTMGAASQYAVPIDAATSPGSSPRRSESRRQ